MDGLSIPRESNEFNPSSAFPEPRLWIKELRILKDLSDSPSDLVRSIPLRRGLNLIWADPEKDMEVKKGERLVPRGHNAGKTLFCRIIRYVLGEPNFGTEAQMKRIQESPLGRGWTVANVILMGRLWLVFCPFSKFEAPRAVPDKGFEDLGAVIKQLPPGRKSYESFLKELEGLVAPIKKNGVLPYSELEVHWAHILQLLSRDQECQYTKILEWRATESESNAPDIPSAADRSALIRSSIGIWEKIEQEMEKKHKKQKADLITKKDLLQRTRHECDYLKAKLSLPTDSESIDEFSEGLFSASEEERERKLEEHFRDERNAALNSPRIVEINERIEVAQKDFAVSEKVANDKAAEIKNLEKRLEFEQQVFSSDADRLRRAEVVAKLNAENGKCNTPIEVATERGCPCCTFVPIDFQTAKILQEKAQNKDRDIALWQKALAKRQADLTSLRQIAAEKRQRLEQLKEERQALQSEIDKKILAVQKREIAIKMRLDIWDALRTREDGRGCIDDAIRILNANIKRQSADLAEFRNKFDKDKDAFDNAFLKIIGYVFGIEATGKVKWGAESITPQTASSGTISGSALKSLSFLAFDIAVLIYTAEGKGHLPGFLMHDSPRVADLEPIPYRRIFEFIADCETKYAGGLLPNFQYIVTTTEPPPKELQQKPWLVESLDASTRNGLLLKTSF